MSYLIQRLEPLPIELIIFIAESSPITFNRLIRTCHFFRILLAGVLNIHRRIPVTLNEIVKITDLGMDHIVFTHLISLETIKFTYYPTASTLDFIRLSRSEIANLDETKKRYRGVYHKDVSDSKNTKIPSFSLLSRQLEREGYVLDLEDIYKVLMMRTSAVKMDPNFIKVELLSYVTNRSDIILSKIDPESIFDNHQNVRKINYLKNEIKIYFQLLNLDLKSLQPLNQTDEVRVQMKLIPEFLSGLRKMD